MKRNLNSTVALAYDFDETFAVKNMLYYIEDVLGVDREAFEERLWALADEIRGDLLLICMYLLVDSAREVGKPFTAQTLREVGKYMEPFPGLPGWFERINAHGASLGLDVEHYIISSNIREILEGTLVAPYCKRIYGSSYIYDTNGYACWPALSVDYTNKTQFLFRISKGCLDESDIEGVNAKVQAEDKRIPFPQIIFVGDGETDVPCMKLMRQKGGHSFAVYNPEKPKSRDLALTLEKEGRVCTALPADYREDAPMDKAVKAILDSIAADLRLKKVLRGPLK